MRSRRNVTLFICLFSLFFLPFLSAQEESAKTSEPPCKNIEVKVEGANPECDKKLEEKIDLFLKSSGKPTGSMEGMKMFFHGEDFQEDKACLGIFLGESEDGVLISQVAEGGPAEKGGLKAKDQLLRINEIDISTLPDLMQAMAALKPGDDIVVKVKRGDEEVVCEVKAGSTKEVFGTKDVIGIGAAPGMKLPQPLPGKVFNRVFRIPAGKGIAELKENVPKILKGDNEGHMFFFDTDAEEGECTGCQSFDIEEIIKKHKGDGPCTKTKTFSFPGGQAVVKVIILDDEGCERECEIKAEIECHGECCGDAQGHGDFRMFAGKPRGNVMIFQNRTQKWPDECGSTNHCQCEERCPCCGRGYDDGNQRGFGHGMDCRSNKRAGHGHYSQGRFDSCQNRHFRGNRMRGDCRSMRGQRRGCGGGCGGGHMGMPPHQGHGSGCDCGGGCGGGHMGMPPHQGHGNGCDCGQMGMPQKLSALGYISSKGGNCEGKGQGAHGAGKGCSEDSSKKIILHRVEEHCEKGNCEKEHKEKDCCPEK